MSEYLDAVQARIEGATKEPWETRINDLTDEVTVVHDSEAVLQVAWIDGDYRHTWAMPDAEFIANARTDLPRLLAAIRAVEEVHQKRGASWPHNGGVFVCGADGAIWPCPTIRALTNALEGER